MFLNALLGLFGALALMAAAMVLFQSQRAENALTGEDESAIRGLLEVWGKNDSLGYFATRRDKAVVFADERARRDHLPPRGRVSAWPAATRSAIHAPGRRPSTRGCDCARRTAGPPA